MKKAINILRAAVLAAIGALGLILLLGEEQETETSAFVLRFLLDKSLGMLLIGLACTMLSRWSKAGLFGTLLDEE